MIQISSRLPPLNALRAFEAAARHNGFVGASEELHVTRGAISRHVKLLEEHLGVQLFRRHSRGIDLTEAGRRLLPVLTEAFERIGRAASQLSADAADLKIICPPATSVRWLIPRIAHFRARHPDLRVRLTTDFTGEQGFDRLAYDVAFSVEHWPRNKVDMEMMTLFPVRLTPACTPALRQSLRHPSDLKQHTLLHETNRRLDWSAWLEAFPEAGIDANLAGEVFSNLDLAMRAAVLGSGVVMADLVLCQEELSTGSLVAPFPDLVCPSPLGDVCLIGARERWDDPKVRVFREWVAEVAAAETAAGSLAGSGEPRA